MENHNEVILLLGKTGAGKSTLGNQLLESRENKPFTASDNLVSQTSKCEVATLTINGKEYDLVDTPGLFDNKGIDPLKEITEFIHKCAGGVRAILLVIEAGKITDEEKNALSTIRKFLGKDATDNFIIVFSKASPERVKDKKIAWHKIDVLRYFIEQIEDRWRVAPLYVSPMFPQLIEVYRETNEQRLMEIKACISHIKVLYTTKQFEETQRILEEKQREEREKEERKKKEYENKLKKKGAEEERAKLQAKQEVLLKELEIERKRNSYQESYREVVEVQKPGLTVKYRSPVVWPRVVRNTPVVEGPRVYTPVIRNKNEIIFNYSYDNVTNERSEEVTNERSKEVTNERSKEVTNERSKEVTNERSKEVTNGSSKEGASEGLGIAGNVLLGALYGTIAEPGVGTIVGALSGFARGMAKK